MEKTKKRPCEFDVLVWEEYEPSEGNEAAGEYKTVEGYGLFHRWGTGVEGQGNRGAMSITVGLVEAQDGQMYTVHPSDIKFLDQ